MRPHLSIYILILFLSLALPIDLVHSQSKKRLSLGEYSYKLQKSEKSEESLWNKQILYKVKSGKSEILLNYRPYPAQSIKTVREKMKKLGAQEKSLKHAKFGKSAIFFFHTKDSSFIFSTKGGMLTVVGPPQLRSFKSLIKARVGLI